MVALAINVNDEQWLAGLTDAQRGRGFASVVAVRRTGQAVAKAMKKEVVVAFDRPTPATKNAFYSSARGLPRRQASTWVGVKDFFPKGTPASQYLRPQVFGGPREQKRSERALAAAGLMGNRGFWVPGPGVRLNVFGNVTGPTMTRILSAVRASRDATQNITGLSRNRNVSARRGERFFVPRIGSRLPPGVWKVSGKRRKLTPVLFFVASVGYRKRFDFFGIGRRLTLRRFPVELRAAIEEEFNLPRTGTR